MIEMVWLLFPNNNPFSGIESSCSNL